MELVNDEPDAPVPTGFKPPQLTPTAVDKLSRIVAHQSTVTGVVCSVDGTVFTAGQDHKASSPSRVAAPPLQGHPVGSGR